MDRNVKEMKFISHSKPDLDSQDPIALKECIDRGFVGWDKDIDEILRKNIQKYVCKDQVVITPSGSMALLMALRALGVGPQDPVLMPAIDCWSVYNAIKFLGARPVVCDVRHSKDFRADFDTIAQQVDKNVKVVIVTHMFGVLIEEELIRRIKEELKLYVIEDYASSFGALYNNSSPVGRYSDFVIGSFAATKPITSGAGGFIAGNDVFWQEAHQGPVDGLAVVNCQISSLNQRLLECQLLRFDQILDKKMQLKQLYSRFVKIWGDESHGLYRAITFDNTDGLRSFFNDKGFQLDIRQSAQPNLAQSLHLNLSNSKDFQGYSSLPFHSNFVVELVHKGLLRE